MNNGIQQKLLWSFLGVAVVSLLTINLLINIVISYSFSNYLEAQRVEETNILKRDLISTYRSDIKWSEDTLMGISHYALMKNLEFRLYGLNQQILWDSTTMVNPSSPAEKSSDKDHNSLESIKIPLMKDQTQIGTLEIKSSNGDFHEHESKFLNLSNLLNWISMGIVLVGVYYFSRYISMGISSPLIHIKDVAVHMKEGDLSSRVNLNRTSSEIKEVGEALNNLAQSLQEQDHLRKNLTADIAHELRTPLAILRGQMEAFQDGVWVPEENKIQICHDQVMQLIHLVNDLEKLAEIENPMLKLQMERINLNQLIEEAAHSVQSLWAEKEIQFKLHTNQSFYITGDNRRLHQVFINLLTNAYKYNREKGEVSIHIHEKEHFIQVDVEDTGFGISSVELPYIFNRFYRGDKSRNRKTGGAGIGLAVVKGIIEAHKGEVMVDSKVDRGTIFTVFLPK